MSKDMSERMPKDILEGMSEDMSERMSKDISKRMSERMSEDLTKDIWERMSQDMPERMSEKRYVRVSKHSRRWLPSPEQRNRKYRHSKKTIELCSENWSLLRMSPLSGRLLFSQLQNVAIVALNVFGHSANQPKQQRKIETEHICREERERVRMCEK